MMHGNPDAGHAAHRQATESGLLKLQRLHQVYDVLPEPFDVSNGLLTPSMKLRRDEIVRTYAFEIEAMYEARSHRRPRTVPEEPAAWEDADNVFFR